MPTRAFARRAARAAQRSGLFVALAASALCGGCSAFSGTSAKQAIAQVDWSAADNAILVEIHADDELNQHLSEAHTLLIGLFQAADADAFRKLAADPASLAQALGATPPAGTVLQTVRYVVQPGGHSILSIDRVAKAKVVGLIAGYYVMDPKTSARLFEIPLAISNTKLLGHNYVAQPQTLALKILLGKSGIDEAVRLNPEPPEITAAAERARAQQQVVPLDGGGREIPLAPAGASGPGTAAIALPN